MGQLASCLPNSGPLSGARASQCPAHPTWGLRPGVIQPPACLAQGLYPGVSQRPAHLPLSLEEKLLLGCNLVGPPPGDTRDKMLGSWGGGGHREAANPASLLLQGSGHACNLALPGPSLPLALALWMQLLGEVGGAFASVQPS